MVYSFSVTVSQIAHQFSGLKQRTLQSSRASARRESRRHALAAAAAAAAAQLPLENGSKGSVKLEKYLDVAPQALQMFGDNIPERDRPPPARVANHS